MSPDRLITEEAIYCWHWRLHARGDADRAALMILGGACTEADALRELIGATHVRVVPWLGRDAGNIAWLPRLMRAMLNERTTIIEDLERSIPPLVFNGADEAAIRELARLRNRQTFDDHALQAVCRGIIAHVLAMPRRRGRLRGR